MQLHHSDKESLTAIEIMQSCFPNEHQLRFQIAECRHILKRAMPMHIMHSHFDIDTLSMKKIYIRIFICVHNSLFAKAATAHYVGFVSSRGLIPIDGYID